MKKIVRIDDELSMTLKAFTLRDCVQIQFDIYKNDGTHIELKDSDKVMYSKIAMKSLLEFFDAGGAC